MTTLRSGPRRWKATYDSHTPTTTVFRCGAWTEDLVDAYLALGRVDEAVTAVTRASLRGHSEAGELLCELAEKLMRSGHEPKARGLWNTARTEFPDDVWVLVQAGIEYHDLGDHATALSWLTTGVEVALHTGDPESALDQLVPLRAACQTALATVSTIHEASSSRSVVRQRVAGTPRTS